MRHLLLIIFGTFLSTIVFGQGAKTAHLLSREVGELYLQPTDLQGLEATTDTITVGKEASANISRQANGLGLRISRDELDLFPSINRSLLDYLKISSLAGNAGVLGRAGRDNYISIDGAGFNNVYGLGGPADYFIGSSAGAEPLGVDAIEAMQIAFSPFDVSQAGFTGARINATSLRGGNKWSANLYSYYSTDALVGNKVDGDVVENGTFTNLRAGASIAGPIVQNKLFFSANFEYNDRTDPASNFIASKPGRSGSNVSRVLATDLEDLSSFLEDEFDYRAGLYEGYDLSRSDFRLMAKLEGVLNDKNRFSLRFSHLDASREIPNTNSQLYGAGNRVNNPFAMSFQTSGAEQSIKATSVIGELVSEMGERTSNHLSISYSQFPESTKPRGELFPSVDILQQGRTYISFGSNFLATRNSLEQRSIQLRDELSMVAGQHKLTFGVNLAKYSFEYDFLPGSAGSYIFNSLEDFYNSAPIGTLTPVGLSNGIGRPSTFAIRYSTSNTDASTAVDPGFSQYSFYVKDQLKIGQLQLNAGVRLDYFDYAGAPATNSDVAALSFQDETGATESFSTNTLPSGKLMVSPRLGFSWTPKADSGFRLRGGAGIFVGMPTMVRIGDQFINNGVTQGSRLARNNQANQYPFNPNPSAYIPDDRATPSTYNLSLVSEDYTPQSLFRTNVGADFQFGEGWTLSADVMYSNDLNRDFARNANLESKSLLTGADGRQLYGNASLNRPPVLGAYVLDNTNLGEQTFYTLQLRKEFSNDWSTSFGYTFGQSKDANSFADSDVRTAFLHQAVNGNTNKPTLAFSALDQRHRLVGFIAKKMDLMPMGKTAISFFLEAAQEGRFSYTYSGNGDLNQDGVAGNDLIFIPSTQSQINLQPYNLNGANVTAEAQWAALDAFIKDSKYLSENRGKIAERNGSLLPAYVQTNMKLAQYLNLQGEENKLEIHVDIFNVLNLLNSAWGVRQLPANVQPIQAMNNGTFRVNPDELAAEFVNDNSLISRWQIQFGVKYRIN